MKNDYTWLVLTLIVLLICCWPFLLIWAMGDPL